MVEIPIPAKKIKIEGIKDHIKPVTNKHYTESELYIKLQLGVLHSLRAGRRTLGPPTAVNAQQLSALVPIVLLYAQQVVHKGGNVVTDSKLQVIKFCGQFVVQLTAVKTCIFHQSGVCKQYKFQSSNPLLFTGLPRPNGPINTSSPWKWLCVWQYQQLAIFTHQPA